MGKKEKYGSYLCKVGYLDVRQKIQMPTIRKMNNGEKQTFPGKVEVFVYHGKNQIAGPFISHAKAIESANELVGKSYKFNKFEK
tara:strand:- start:83 stop:334 length:252 start_codon:yes stop_codon:yes gene_type:complete